MGFPLGIWIVNQSRPIWAFLLDGLVQRFTWRVYEPPRYVPPEQRPRYRGL